MLGHSVVLSARVGVRRKITSSGSGSPFPRCPHTRTHTHLSPTLAVCSPGRMGSSRLVEGSVRGLDISIQAPAPQRGTALPNLCFFFFSAPNPLGSRRLTRTATGQAVPAPGPQGPPRQRFCRRLSHGALPVHAECLEVGLGTGPGPLPAHSRSCQACLSALGLGSVTHLPDFRSSEPSATLQRRDGLVGRAPGQEGLRRVPPRTAPQGGAGAGPAHGGGQVEVASRSQAFVTKEIAVRQGNQPSHKHAPS